MRSYRWQMHANIRNINDYIILKPENPLAFRINKKKKCKVCLISPLNIKVLVSIVH